MLSLFARNLISAISERIVGQLCCNHLTSLGSGSGTKSGLLEDVVVGKTVLIIINLVNQIILSSLQTLNG